MRPRVRRTILGALAVLPPAGCLENPSIAALFVEAPLDKRFKTTGGENAGAPKI
jgi:hypothetical protein